MASAIEALEEGKAEFEAQILQLIHLVEGGQRTKMSKRAGAIVTLNELIERYFEQALDLLGEGCTPQQVDAAIERWGFAMGPFRMIDLAGNDVSWRIRQERAKAGTLRRAQPLADALCEAGRLGQKTGAGWYDYPGGFQTGCKAG